MDLQKITVFSVGVGEHRERVGAVGQDEAEHTVVTTTTHRIPAHWSACSLSHYHCREVHFSLFLLLLISQFSYIYFFPRTLSDAVINLWPLVLFPVIVFTLKKFTQSYFTYSIGRTDERIADLKEQRRSILDNVKDSETFTVWGLL